MEKFFFCSSSNAEEQEKIIFIHFQMMRCEFKSILDNNGNYIHLLFIFQG